MQKKVRKAVIPAAGYGTRFLPVTKAIPKEMIPIVDKPVIQYIVEEALQSGIEEILIITGHGKRAIEDHFDTNIDLELQLRQQGKTRLLRMVQVFPVSTSTISGKSICAVSATPFVVPNPLSIMNLLPSS